MGRANWLYFLGTKSNKYEHFIYGISLPTSNVNRYNLNKRLGKIGNKRLYVFESITDDIDIPNLKNNSIDLNLYHKDIKETIHIVHKNKYIQSYEPEHIRIASPIGQTVYVNSYYSNTFYNINNGMFLEEENRGILLALFAELDKDSNQNFIENYSQRLGCFEYIEAMPWAESAAPFSIYTSKNIPNKYIIKRDNKYSQEILYVHLIVYSIQNNVLLDEFKIFDKGLTALEFDTELINDAKYKYSVFDAQGKLIYKDSNHWMLGISLQMNMISDTVQIKSKTGIKTISAYTPVKPVEIHYPDNKIIQNINSNIKIINDIKKDNSSSNNNISPEQKWFDKNEDLVQSIINFIKKYLNYNSEILIVDPFISPESLELLMNINNTSIKINIISCWGNNDPDSNNKSPTDEIIKKTRELIKKFASTSFPIGNLIWHNLGKENFHDRFIYIVNSRESKLFMLSNSINNLSGKYNIIISELTGSTKEHAIKYITSIKANCTDTNRIFPEVENV
ncbi:MAG: VPA1262 family N-terminal domain-containing protein [Candidatus Gastranaerophilaceae bacterium]|nr:VPA1262 family N-terminal domain-containing protein [Candidatus Gastranaerophilaceae bacterium]